MQKYIFTSESVTEGHPDKICDYISDSILDAYLKKDKDSRVAIECLAKTGFIIVAGEIRSNADIDIQDTVRTALKEIGYNAEFGFDPDSIAVLISISKQSEDIAIGVDASQNKEQGAGDQGLMFGYANNETKELMPLPITLAHKLAFRLAEIRKKNVISYLGPDGKTQASVLYENEKASSLEAVVVSAQHKEGISQKQIQKDIKENVIDKICNNYLSDKTKIFVNPTGKFVKGGPIADAGLTGRKIIVDTYGGFGRHGGGCFSGKDPSKVDRSAAYYARYVAKSVVANNLADKCELQVAYAIGVAEPVSLHINCFGTEKIAIDEIERIIKENFDFRPASIIEELKLKRPIYKKTASYGHFGREEFPWEKVKRL